MANTIAPNELGKCLQNDYLNGEQDIAFYRPYTHKPSFFLPGLVIYTVTRPMLTYVICQIIIAQYHMLPPPKLNEVTLFKTF